MPICKTCDDVELPDESLIAIHGVAGHKLGLSYKDFIEEKTQLGSKNGFALKFLPSFLFDFQSDLVTWSVEKGRAAIFADCGMGKTPMQLVWAQNVVEHANKPVLVLCPLAVSAQTIQEAGKFSIDAQRSRDGKFAGNRIIVTNYEQLHKFNWQDFGGCVCDESSILKSFDGARRSEITEFMRKVPYRLLCTATAAPNDYIELGTSSEALGELGHMDMLMRFFKNDQATIKAMSFQGHDKPKWRFKGHAEIPFWRWLCSWARAIRKPSDLGYDDRAFILPELIEKEHFVDSESIPDGMLFAMPAVGLKEEREERRRTIQERCERVAQLVDDGHSALIWGHLNDECDLLEEIIKGSVQVSGADSDDEKEEKFTAFASGKIKDLITKPKIGAWGLNFQNCAHVVSFASHSFEQYYQSVRRCWRFGQTRPVRSDIVVTEGEKSVIENLKRKSAAADRMFQNLVAEMGRALHIDRGTTFQNKMEIPKWL
ncbi:MAG: DEAD/DEAH box helicase [Candidatus Sulfotelmatobacter sp.]